MAAVKKKSAFEEANDFFSKSIAQPIQKFTAPAANNVFKFGQNLVNDYNNFNQQKQQQEAHNQAQVMNFARDFANKTGNAFQSATTNVKNYFDPTQAYKAPNTGPFATNFWNTNAAAGAGNLQNRLQTGNLINPFARDNRFDQVPLYKPLSQAGNFVANLPSQIINSVYGQGVTAPTADITKLFQNYFQTGRYTPYSQLKSGPVKLGAQMGGVFNADVARQMGTPLNLQEYLGNLGQTAEPILNAYMGSSLPKAFMSQLEAKAAGRFLPTFIKGGLENIIPGALSGIASGLNEGRRGTQQQQFLQAGTGGAVGAALGFGLGGTFAGAGYGLSKLGRKLVSKFGAEAEQMLANQAIIEKNVLGIATAEERAHYDALNQNGEVDAFLQKAFPEYVDPETGAFKSEFHDPQTSPLRALDAAADSRAQFRVKGDTGYHKNTSKFNMQMKLEDLNAGQDAIDLIRQGAKTNDLNLQLSDEFRQAEESVNYLFERYINKEKKFTSQPVEYKVDALQHRIDLDSGALDPSITHPGFENNMLAGPTKVTAETPIGPESGIRIKDLGPAFRTEPGGEFDMTKLEGARALSSLFSDKEIQFLTGKTGDFVTPEGKLAQGKQYGTLIQAVEQNGLVESKTVFHEAFHAYANNFADKILYNEALREAVSTGLAKDAKGAEEVLAEGFADFMGQRKTFSGQIHQFFQYMVEQIKSMIGRESSINLMFGDIVAKRRQPSMPSGQAMAMLRKPAAPTEILQILDEAIKSNPEAAQALYDSFSKDYAMPAKFEDLQTANVVGLSSEHLGGENAQEQGAENTVPPTSSEPLQLSSGQPAKDTPEGLVASVQARINKIYSETLDRFHPLSSVAKKAGAKGEIAMRRALTGYYGTGSTAQYHINFELGLILQSVDVKELRRAAIALRDAELQAQGKQGSNTGALGELFGKQGQGLKDPTMGEALQKLYAYQDSLVQRYLVDTGIMSQEAYQAMKAKNQFYVPFQRVMEDVDEWLGVPKTKGAGSIGSQNVVFGYKGSKLPIHDPLESIIENTYKMVGLGRRQEVARTLVGLKNDLPEGMIKQVFKTQFNSKDIIRVFENGQVKQYRVPTEVAEAAKGLNEDQLSTLVKILAKPTELFRATATGLNPEFASPNIGRDTQSAFINTGLNPLGFASGLAHYIKQDNVYQEFLQSGGLVSRVSLNRAKLQSKVGEIATKNKGIAVLKGGNLFEVLGKIGQMSEQPTRIAAFEQALNEAIKNGIPREQALQDAAYAAQEATVNFARRGSKMTSINAVYAFLNARMQGIDRLVRSIKKNPLEASTRIGMITVAPALGLYAWNRNFQSYNDDAVVPQYEKDNNFIMMLSDQPIDNLGGAQYLKFPKGDVGRLANPVESFMSYLDGKGGDVRGSLLAALQSFSPIQNTGDAIPTTLRPIAETAANYNFFYDRQLVSDSKQNYPAEFQYDKGTPGVYKEIGRVINQSPAKVENILRGYLTGFARIGEMLGRPFEKNDTYSGANINKTPVVRRFMGGPVRSGQDQQLNNYFQQKGILNKIQEIKTGIKYGNIPLNDGMNEIKRLLEENQKNLPSQQQSYFGPQGASAATTTQDPIQKQILDDQINLQVQLTGKSQITKGNIAYPNETGGVSHIDLSPPTTGKGIDAFVNSDWQVKKALEIYKAGDAIKPEQKQKAYEQLGVDPSDLDYAYKSGKNNDIKMQYILGQNLDHDTLFERMVTGRVVSVAGDLFATDGVLEDLVKRGQLSKQEAKYLKSLRFDKSGNNLNESTSSGGKGKKHKKISVANLSVKPAKQVRLNFGSTKASFKPLKPIKVKRVALPALSTAQTGKTGAKLYTPKPIKFRKMPTVKTLGGLGGLK